MSYQALARKYRPQQFAEVIGQEHVTQTLLNALKLQRVHHAYLFTGARGIGKTTIARLMAKVLNCESGACEPCGTCRSCQEITQGTSLDVQEIDGASHTGVDDVREIREQVKFLPTSGKYKIYIIDEVHMLSTSAFNALLKTLEEPPAHVIFIFATTEVHKIPATILSRCQRYDFRRISVKRITEALREIATLEQIEVNDAALQLLAKEASGSMRDAQSLFDQAIAFAGKQVTLEHLKSMLGFLDRQLFFQYLQALADRDAKRALLALEEIFAQGTDLLRFTTDVLEHVRHLMVLRECPDAEYLIDLPQEEYEDLKKIATQLSVEDLQRSFAIWYQGVADLARSQMPKMLLEVLTLRIAQAEPLRSLAELVSKIDQVLEGPVENVAPANVQKTAAVGNADLRSVRPQESKINLSDESWQGFMRALTLENPRLSSILQQMEVKFRGDEGLEFSSKSRLYADMIREAERQTQLSQALAKHFSRSIGLHFADHVEEVKNFTEERQREKQLTQEALQSNLVRDAAQILGAQIYDVKTRK